MSLELWASLFLLGFALLAAVSLVRFHKNPQYEHFNLIDLITCKEGKISRPASMEVGAFVVMTWGFVVYVNNGSLTDWYAGLYIGTFVARAAHSAWLSSKSNGVEQK